MTTSRLAGPACSMVRRPSIGISAPPDGEAYDTAIARVRSWLDAVDGRVVAVSHGLVGRLIRGAYLGLPREEALVLPVPQDVVWHLAHGRVEALAA